MPASPITTIPARERDRIVRALRVGGRLIMLRGTSGQTAMLDGKPIPHEWVVALGRQQVITPAMIDRTGASYALTMAWKED